MSLMTKNENRLVPDRVCACLGRAEGEAKMCVRLLMLVGSKSPARFRAMME
jgi:hypothetical protein